MSSALLRLTGRPSQGLSNQSSTGQQAAWSCEHRARHSRSPDGGLACRTRVAAALSRGATRRRLERADPAHQRRRARAALDASELRSAQDLPRARGGGPVGESALAKLREGLRLEDGMTAPAQVRRIERDVLELTIHEGRNRQVRRMCEAVGHPVRSARAHRVRAAEAWRARAGRVSTAWRSRARTLARRPGGSQAIRARRRSSKAALARAQAVSGGSRGWL